MRDIVLEVCVESLAACRSARDGGAMRLELCSALDVGGLTPSAELVRGAIAETALPVHVMIRPRAGDFVYSAAEFAMMLYAIDEAKVLGASGVVLGLLHGNRTVDVDRTSRLVGHARPMEVTFHRAFDDVADVGTALEDVIATGCDRVLTSGGAPDVVAGAAELAKLVTRANGRIVIAVGGGLRLRDAQWLARRTNATHFHGSMTETGFVEADTVSSMLRLLREA